MTTKATRRKRTVTPLIQHTRANAAFLDYCKRGQWLPLPGESPESLARTKHKLRKYYRSQVAASVVDRLAMRNPEYWLEKYNERAEVRARDSRFRSLLNALSPSELARFTAHVIPMTRLLVNPDVRPMQALQPRPA